MKAVILLASSSLARNLPATVYNDYDYNFVPAKLYSYFFVIGYYMKNIGE